MSNSKNASVVWSGNGMDFTATGGSGFTMNFSPNASTSAGSPMEAVAMAAGGCTAMDVISILQKKQQKVSGFEVKVLGVRAEEHPQVYTEVQLEFIVRGQGVDPKAVERAIELSLTKYCSVNLMLGKTAKITHSYRIEEA